MPLVHFGNDGEARPHCHAVRAVVQHGDAAPPLVIGSQQAAPAVEGSFGAQSNTSDSRQPTGRQLGERRAAPTAPTATPKRHSPGQVGRGAGGGCDGGAGHEGRRQESGGAPAERRHAQCLLHGELRGTASCRPAREHGTQLVRVAVCGGEATLLLASRFKRRGCRPRLPRGAWRLPASYASGIGSIPGLRLATRGQEHRGVDDASP